MNNSSVLDKDLSLYLKDLRIRVLEEEHKVLITENMRISCENTLLKKRLEDTEYVK
ncbi:hypothetical protein [Clostridium sp. LP20]|uniref:hypothetical protein n=1 Tax=Clostridium sp. LP20 TaxID=3418665 RepID=UPI003EE6FBA7